MPKPKLELKKNYLAAIRGSVNSRLFQSVFLRENGELKDVTEKGVLSCANFVSWVLYHFNLIKEPHISVSGLVKDMEGSGWKKIKRPRVGAVIAWEHSMEHGDEPHRHIGFYIGSQKAISNSTKKRVPHMHHWTFGKRGQKPKRKIEAIYWHKKLD